MSLDTERQIMETIQMISEDKLDVRTVTMGLSLLDCADSDVQRACARIEDRIVQAASRLVATAGEVSREFGVPIINKRISVTPISLVAAACRTSNPLPFAQALDRAGKAVGVDFVGGYSALVDAGATQSDLALIDSIPEALASTDIVCSSVNIGSTRTGINMSAARRMGQVVVDTAQATGAADGIGAAKLVVFANAVGDNPFMAGAFHGVSQPDTVISVGISGPGVVQRALQTVRGRPFEECAEAIKKSAFKITRMGQLVGQTVAQRLSVPFGIVDLSLAPTAEVGDSVAAILEEMGVSAVGAPGTTAALFLLNDAVKKGGLMACSMVGGLSGSFIPVSEDMNMINGVQRGSITMAKLEAMTAICSVGLDMIAIPGDTSPATITGLIADEAAIGIASGKTAAVRVIPVPGKSVGDSANFGGLLGWAPVMGVSQFSSADFAARGGRIPAPVHSFRN
ncbi:PFL family protein [Mobiluncus curtisii]|uniref:PFL family protein n=1 Tax=Mobiluncus curtisii TaxID=2051 RepID=UPI0014707A12|nr:PFL family protein [Mobiluncus curtisii]NMW89561.1 PFL family protein [Mobiluncus curtisii]